MADEREARNTNNVGLPISKEDLQDIRAYASALTPPKSLGKLFMEAFEAVHGDEFKRTKEFRRQMSKRQHRA